MRRTETQLYKIIYRWVQLHYGKCQHKWAYCRHIMRCILAVLIGVGAHWGIGWGIGRAQADTTATPIKHVVVLFPENISFDHYFGTYPYAANISDETLQGSDRLAAQFYPKPGTKIPNNFLLPPAKAGLQSLKPELFRRDPDRNEGFIPFRLSPEQALTCDQNHAYTDEQVAFDNGKMDRFFQVNAAENGDCKNPRSMLKRNDLVMGYYDGNTVTAYWNLAQNFLLNDENFGSVFGPSTPGAINLISGQTAYAMTYNPKTGERVPDNVFITRGRNDPQTTGTLIDDADPLFDDCSNNNGQGSDPVAEISAPNIGDLLNKKQITWGWFQGGFRADSVRPDDKVSCTIQHKTVGDIEERDYSPHHEPFQYFRSTANPHHIPPSSEAMIGHTDAANHQYDVQDFYTALASGNLPAVSFVKPPTYQDGHASTSDPIDESHFTEHLVNQLEQSSAWDSTALIILYDDSDGWYDHQSSPILNGSHTPADRAICTSVSHAVDGLAGRCGPGTRHPLLIVSPYVQANTLNSTHTEQTSVIRFIEDNWGLGRLGGGSFDERAGSLIPFFNFAHPARKDKVWLDEVTGAITTQDKVTPLHKGNSMYQLAEAAAQISWFDSWGKIVICIIALIAFLSGAVYLLSRKYKSS